MKPLHFALALAAANVAGVACPLVPPASATGLPVFDIANYSQNLIQAARALQQINNQVRSLQNETAMLQNMARNLKTIDFPQLQRMNSAMQRINELMAEAQHIDFKVEGLDERVKAIFPGELQTVLTSDERLKESRSELDAARDAYRQAMDVQAQIAESAEQDAGLLNELVASSQGSAGALQVSQASNQLLALSIKQQLQLQNLMASAFRDQAIERARQVQAAEDGRVTTQRFLQGSTPAHN